MPAEIDALAAKSYCLHFEAQPLLPSSLSGKQDAPTRPNHPVPRQAS